MSLKDEDHIILEKRKEGKLEISYEIKDPHRSGHHILTKNVLYLLSYVG